MGLLQKLRLLNCKNLLAVVENKITTGEVITMGALAFTPFDDTIIVVSLENLNIVEIIPKKEKVRTPAIGGVIEWRPAVLEDLLNQGRKFYLPLPFPYFSSKMICSDGFCVKEPKNSAKIEDLEVMSADPTRVKKEKENGVLRVTNFSEYSFAILMKDKDEIISVPPMYVLSIMPNTCWVNEESGKTYCYEI
uniref:Uncharacterized protein n=1 Tax=Candidatus Aramenus sulfurataquae TaxID=1326980 RepID=A0A0F2LNV6_9CREN